MQQIFLLFKVSLILTNKILGWSEDLRTFWTSEHSTSLLTLQLRSLTMLKKLKMVKELE